MRDPPRKKDRCGRIFKFHRIMEVRVLMKVVPHMIQRHEYDDDTPDQVYRFYAGLADFEFHDVVVVAILV